MCVFFFQEDAGIEIVKSLLGFGDVFRSQGLYCNSVKIFCFLGNYPQVKHGVDCINFRKKDDVDLKAMKKVILQAMSG